MPAFSASTDDRGSAWPSSPYWLASLPSRAGSERRSASGRASRYFAGTRSRQRCGSTSRCESPDITLYGTRTLFPPVDAANVGRANEPFLSLGTLLGKSGERQIDSAPAMWYSPPLTGQRSGGGRNAHQRRERTTESRRPR